LALFGFFRSRPRIADSLALADFIDENSAFLVQKGLYEYSRARAGHYAKVLFRERAFLEAVEQSRWRAYPLGLAMVGEMVEGVLRPPAAEDRRAALEALSTIVLSVFDRYPVPTPLTKAVWFDTRRELARRLALIGLHPRKLVKDIPEPFCEAYFSLIPIHEKLRGSDYPTMRNYLRVSLINIHDEFEKRMDARALADTLRAEAG
jgi:hypothetical protein